jgi:hypothetical protein
VPKGGSDFSPITSTVLIGDRNSTSARMFAEYVASKKGKIALVSIYLESANEVQARLLFMKLIEKILNPEKQETSN